MPYLIALTGLCVAYLITFTIMMIRFQPTYTEVLPLNLALFPVCLLRRPHGQHTRISRKFDLWQATNTEVIRGGITSVIYDSHMRVRELDDMIARYHEVYPLPSIV